MKLSTKNIDKTKLKKQIKRIVLIIIGFFLLIGIFAYCTGRQEQSNLEKENVKISISGINDEISLDYHTKDYQINAKVSGISILATAKVNDRTVSIKDHNSGSHEGTIDHKIDYIPEGDTYLDISVTDGNRHINKTIKFKRQTKSDYDQQEAKKKEAEEKVRKEKEEAEKKAKEEALRAEEARKNEAAKAQQQNTPQKQAPAPKQQRSAAPQSQPAPQNQNNELYFNNCDEARSRGYKNIPQGSPGYRPKLDRDHDGIACNG